MDENTQPAPPAPTYPSPATLGAFIHVARERSGLTLRDLAAITGISRPMLSRLELDQMDNPSPALLHRLADALELNSDDLFAFLGYRPSERLPSLAPYLRAKYQLPPHAVAEAHVALQSVFTKYNRSNSSEPRATPDISGTPDPADHVDPAETSNTNSADNPDKQ